ncbi:MarR family winged helix-turn-helix transcriptional regulator [Roseibium sp. RKSG952]|uniref:MarR family winged helix-turn-helix transcriptional regulator n=1 Tax=Roseibium sp. RKSG952 TaxID=2529384 RepID=UPI0012BD60DF|nr:MarR family winged helix-turn-helix transcriptional regulator [Roseibium sp. RKSG952]MTH97565.1 MarR family transcriptional regulator [Roseibium sp. RKSG952]
MYQIKEGLSFQISLTTRVMERHFERLLAPHGLTRLMWCILVMAGHYRITKPSQMADHICVDRTAISRVLRSMELAGLIAREKSKSDGRGRDVVLTGHGSTKLEALLPDARDCARHFDEKLAGDEPELLKRLLGKLTEGEPVTFSEF